MAGKAGEVLRNLLALAGVFALGYWLAGARAVHASSDDVQFELQGVNENSSLLVYQPSTSIEGRWSAIRRCSATSCFR